MVKIKIRIPEFREAERVYLQTAIKNKRKRQASRYDWIQLSQNTLKINKHKWIQTGRKIFVLLPHHLDPQNYLDDTCFLERSFY